MFSLGLTSLLVRRNLIFVLMSLEVMLNAAGLAFVVELDFLKGREKLAKYDVFSLMHYDK